MLRPLPATNTKTSVANRNQDNIVLYCRDSRVTNPILYSYDSLIYVQNKTAQTYHDIARRGQRESIFLDCKTDKIMAEKLSDNPKRGILKATGHYEDPANKPE